MDRKIAFYSIFLLSMAANADEIDTSKITTFIPNTPAKAEEVNRNFSEITRAVDDNAHKIKDIQTPLGNGCPEGSALRKVGAGIAACEPTIGAITAGVGSGLTASQVGNVVTLDIAPGAIGASDLAADSVGAAALKKNAVNSLDHIVDEPGIRKSGRNCSYPDITGRCLTLITTSDVNVARVTISAPGKGYVFVTFSAMKKIYHTLDTGDWLSLEINDSAAAEVCVKSIYNSISTWDCNDSYRYVSIHRSLPTGTYDDTITTHAQFTVPAAGTYTYYLDAKSSKDTGINIGGVYSLTAMYFPTQY